MADKNGSSFVPNPSLKPGARGSAKQQPDEETEVKPETEQGKVPARKPVDIDKISKVPPADGGSGVCW